MALPQETMNQTDLPDPVKEDIANLQRANSEMINRILELERQLKMTRTEDRE
jgi:serine O-acetyltransferase